MRVLDERLTFAVDRTAYLSSLKDAQVQCLKDAQVQSSPVQSSPVQSSPIKSSQVHNLNASEPSAARPLSAGGSIAPPSAPQSTPRRLSSPLHPLDLDLGRDLDLDLDCDALQAETDADRHTTPRDSSHHPELSAAAGTQPHLHAELHRLRSERTSLLQQLSEAAAVTEAKLAAAEEEATVRVHEARAAAGRWQQELQAATSRADEADARCVARAGGGALPWQETLALALTHTLHPHPHPHPHPHLSPLTSHLSPLILNLSPHSQPQPSASPSALTLTLTLTQVRGP